MFQGSLFGDAQVGVDQSFAQLTRRALDERCWVDFAPGWLAGADDTFDALVEILDWQQRTVTMYERRLPEPRLTVVVEPNGSASSRCPCSARLAGR